MALLTSENLKTFCWELQLWYELKPFWSLGHVTRPGDLTWCDQDKKNINRCKIDPCKAMQNLVMLLLFVFQLLSKNYRGGGGSKWSLSSGRRLKGNWQEPEKYIPIILTHVDCKVMENFGRDAVRDHLIRNNLISSHQYGYLPGKSTGSQQLLGTGRVRPTLEEGSSVDILHLDFRKAFDVVPRQRLFYPRPVRRWHPLGFFWAGHRFD